MRTSRRACCSWELSGFRHRFLNLRGPGSSPRRAKVDFGRRIEAAPGWRQAGGQLGVDRRARPDQSLSESPASWHARFGFRDMVVYIVEHSQNIEPPNAKPGGRTINNADPGTRKRTSIVNPMIGGWDGFEWGEEGCVTASARASLRSVHRQSQCSVLISEGGKRLARIVTCVGGLVDSHLISELDFCTSS